MTAEVATYLKYANLQIAAEAFIAPKDAAPNTPASGLLTEAILTAGNEHSSRFTQVQAAEFVKDWTVVEHNRNDNQNTTVGNTALALDRVYEFDYFEVGSYTSQTLTAWNSSNRRGNELTALPRERIVFGNDAENTIAGTDTFAVTGYSLGGHLATAFNLLRKEDAEKPQGTPNPISATYTFNGAGVGEVTHKHFAARTCETRDDEIYKHAF